MELLSGYGTNLEGPWDLVMKVSLFRLTTLENASVVDFGMD